MDKPKAKTNKYADSDSENSDDDSPVNLGNRLGSDDSDADAGKQSSKEEKKDVKNVSKQNNKKSIKSNRDKKNKGKDKDVDESDEEDNANNQNPSFSSKKTTLDSQKHSKIAKKNPNDKSTVSKDSNSHETVNSNDSLEEDPDAGINLISAHPESKIGQLNKNRGMTNFSNDSSQPS